MLQVNLIMTCITHKILVFLIITKILKSSLRSIIVLFLKIQLIFFATFDDGKSKF